MIREEPPIVLPAGEEGWRVERRNFDTGEDPLYESLFYLTDGSVGMRASVDYGNPRGRPGFFSRRLYGRGLTTPRQLVNTLNPSYLGLEISGITPRGDDATKLRPLSQDLDLRHAYVSVLYRGLLKGVAIDVRVSRLLPPGRRCLITVVDVDASRPCQVTVRSGISFGHGNSDLAGRQDDVRLRHLELSRELLGADLMGLVCSNRSDGTLVGACTRVWCASFVSASSPYYLPGGVFAQDLVGVYPAGRSQIVMASKYADGGNPEPDERNAFVEALMQSTRKADPQLLVAEHLEDWNKYWLDAPVIDSDRNLTLASRYGAFQMLQLPDRSGKTFNVPARGLSSEYHSGHFFFNSEFFVTPYFIYMDPKVAKAMLRHRIQCLPAALAFAAASGYQGARYPEESDDLGNAAAPREIRDVFSGSSILEWSGVEVVHSTADVLHAISKYVAVTGDRAFLFQECAALLVESAEYLSSVLKWDETVGGYSARSVMGFDEFHYHVDHHYATNWLCSWGLTWIAQELRVDEALSSACEQYSGGRGSDWFSSIGRWAEVGKRTYLPKADVHGVFPVFEEYFRLPEQRKLTNSPIVHSNIPEEDAERADKMEPFKTRLTKQADVVFLMTLFPEYFTDEEVATNLRFYEPRTVHGSSLSMTAHAAAALRSRDDPLAICLLRASLRYNLDYSPRADYENGVHIAAYAGAFLVLVENVLGLRVKTRDIDSSPIVAVRLRVPLGIDRFAVTINVLKHRLFFAWERGMLRVSHAGDEGKQSLLYSVDEIEAVLTPGFAHCWPHGAHSPVVSN